MSGETEANVSGWTVDTLRIHMEAMIAAVDHRHAARMDANEANRTYLLSSLQATDARMNDRFNAVEGMVARQIAALKALMEARMDAAEQAVKIERVDAAQWRASANEWRNAMDDRERKFIPRTESEQRINDLIARVDKVESRVDAREGGAQGAKDYRGLIFGGLTAAVALITIVVFVANLLTK